LSTSYSILMGLDVLLAIAIIALVLLQQGKGANAGAAFGSGASATVFGARGSASFLTRATGVLAAAFFINSLTLAYLASNRPKAESVIDTMAIEQPAGGEGPAAPPDTLLEAPAPALGPEDVPLGTTATPPGAAGEGAREDVPQ
jgi:preprotein translocase subunit SecG